MFSVADVQRLYQQWQDGKLLDNEERQALRALKASEDASDRRFADLMKAASENTTTS